MGSGRRSVRRRVLVVCAAALAVSGCGSPVAHNVLAGVSRGQSVQGAVAGLTIARH